MLLDIGIGILLAIGVSKLFALPLTFFFVATGIIFSLLVDSDALVNLIRHHGIEQSHKHRDLLHMPLLYIPIGMFIVYLCVPSGLNGASGVAFALLFGLCSLAHFIHDSIGIGWGIEWLAPFRDDQYSFFYQYNARRASLPSKHSLYIWKKNDIDTLEEKYGDKDWFRNIYLSWHPYGLTEIAVFVIGIVVLYFSMR